MIIKGKVVFKVEIAIVPGNLTMRRMDDFNTNTETIQCKIFRSDLTFSPKIVRAELSTKFYRNQKHWDVPQINVEGSTNSPRTFKMTLKKAVLIENY